jgi:hypothetical protein
MTGRGVSDNDMPNRSWPSRRDVAGLPDAALAALLAGGALAPDAPPPLQHVADALAALRAAPANDEHVGHAAAVAEFHRRVGMSAGPVPFRHRRPSVQRSLRARIAVASATAVVGLGGLAAAAFADALPAAAQQLAHDTIGAPAADTDHSSHAARHTGTPVGPDARGHAAYGLCTAYAHATEHGDAAEKSVAFRNLERAAGGAARVASYCAAVPHPGATDHPEGKKSSTSSPRRTGTPPPHG